MGIDDIVKNNQALSNIDWLMFGSLAFPWQICRDDSIFCIAALHFVRTWQNKISYLMTESFQFVTLFTI
jgi:hypothetical protein